MSALLPLSLYVHMPWCRKKCPYCDFNSHEARNVIPQDTYLKATLEDLRRDLESLSQVSAQRKITSVFIGGGTPSLMDADLLCQWLADLKAMAPLDETAEITLEANPESAKYAKLVALRQAGINRLSLGAQSFTDPLLKAIGRVHDSNATREAFKNARAAGFDNINLDLMFGLPSQTLEQSQYDVRQAITLAPEHVSLYQLTLEPNTLFHAKPPVLPSEECLWEMEQSSRAELEKQGWLRYEVSAHAQTQRQCKHNLNYWRFGDYLGIGAGAHAKIAIGGSGECVRLSKHRHPDKYLGGMKKSFISSRQMVSGATLVFEFMLNATRLTEGFSAALFEEATQLPYEILQEPLAGLQAQGLVEYDRTMVNITERGFRFLNDIQSAFLPPSPRKIEYMLAFADDAPSVLPFF